MRNSDCVSWVVLIRRVFLISRNSSSLVSRALAIVFLVAFARPLAAQTWTPTGSMIAGRANFTATLLLNGKSWSWAATTESPASSFQTPSCTIRQRGRSRPQEA